MRKCLSMLILFLLIISLCACGAGTQQAPTTVERSQTAELSRSANPGDSGEAGIVIGTEALSQNAGQDGAQIVWYGGHNWYVIGYDGVGNAAAKADLITLLHVTADDVTPFNEVPGNTYRGSALENYLESLLSDGSREIFSPYEQSALVSRKIEGGGANHGQDGYDGGKVKGESVTVPLWPLSAAEA